MITSYLPDEFFAKLRAIGARQNFNPEDALAVMLLESGVKPTSIHPTAPAGGIFGKMFATRAEAEAFTRLSAVEQLDAYESYMSKYRSIPKPAAKNLYQLNFLPASAMPGQANYRGTDDDSVLAARGGTGYGGNEDNYYRSNPILDEDKDGKITVGDLGRILLKVQANNAAKWQELKTRLGMPSAPYTSSKPFPWLAVAIGTVGVLGAAYFIHTNRLLPPLHIRSLAFR